jgi:hypothetical protein
MVENVVVIDGPFLHLESYFVLNFPLIHVSCNINNSTFRGQDLSPPREKKASVGTDNSNYSTSLPVDPKLG